MTSIYHYMSRNEQTISFFSGQGFKLHFHLACASRHMPRAPRPPGGPHTGASNCTLEMLLNAAEEEDLLNVRLAHNVLNVQIFRCFVTREIKLTILL